MNTESCAPVMAWMTDREGRATHVSATWLQQTGRSLADTLGAGWLRDLHPDDRERMETLLVTPPPARRELMMDFRLQLSDGSYRPMTGLIYPIYAADEAFTGWSGSAVPAGDAAASAVFHLISNNMREIVCLIGPDARILYISHAAQTIMGYAPEELIGREIDSFFIPSDQKADFDQYFSEIRSVDGPQYFEIQIPTRSGEKVWLEADMQFLRNERGELINLQIVARDITLRRQHEEMLALQNEIASVLWENADLATSLTNVLEIVLKLDGIDCGGVYITDPVTGGLDLVCHKGVSPVFIDVVSHYPADHPTNRIAATGRPLYIDFDSLIPNIADQNIKEYQKEKLLGFASIPIMHNQEVIAVFNLASHTMAEIPQSSRQVLEFLARQIGAMIARNRAETALRESEEKFRSFFEQTTDTFSLTDEKGIMIEWNHASEQLTGLPRAEAIGRKGVDIQFDLLPPEKRTSVMYEKMKERFAGIHASGKASFFNHILDGQIVDRNGAHRSFQQLIFPIQTSRGFMIGSSGRDVTHVKMIEQAELEQRKLTDALIVSSTILNRSLNLDDIFKNIFHLVENIVPNNGGSLMLISHETGRVRVFGAIGSDHHEPQTTETMHDFSICDFPTLNHMFETRKALIIGDTNTNALWRNFHKDGGMRSFLGVPICVGKQVIGFLNLISEKRDFFQPKHAEWLQAFANQAALAIENARLFAQVERLAVQDELTHIYNRRGLKEIGQREVERALRFEHPLTALFLDVDHFKEINDVYSHAAGDLVLSAVSSCFSELLRSVDIIGRYGGEEFVFLLPETDVDGALVIAERLRSAVEAMEVCTPHGSLRVTVSIGVAPLTYETPTLDCLLEKADAAVHRAKAAGRNRVEVG